MQSNLYEESVRIFYKSDTALNLGLQMLKFLRFEGCKEYGSDSFSGSRIQYCEKKVAQYIEKKRGKTGRNVRLDYSIIIPLFIIQKGKPAQIILIPKCQSKYYVKSNKP